MTSVFGMCEAAVKGFTIPLVLVAGSKTIAHCMRTALLYHHYKTFQQSPKTEEEKRERIRHEIAAGTQDTVLGVAAQICKNEDASSGYLCLSYAGSTLTWSTITGILVYGSYSLLKCVAQN